DQAAGLAVQPQCKFLGGAVCPSTLPGEDKVTVTELDRITFQCVAPVTVGLRELMHEPLNDRHIQRLAEHALALLYGFGVEMAEGQSMDHFSLPDRAWARKMRLAPSRMAIGVSGAMATVSSWERPLASNCS